MEPLILYRMYRDSTSVKYKLMLLTMFAFSALLPSLRQKHPSNSLPVPCDGGSLGAREKPGSSHLSSQHNTFHSLTALHQTYAYLGTWTWKLAQGIFNQLASNSWFQQCHTAELCTPQNHTEKKTRMAFSFFQCSATSFFLFLGWHKMKTRHPTWVKAAWIYLSI